MSFRALLLYLSAYRSQVERTILAVSLSGVVVSLHAAVQLQTGFSNGCLGLGLFSGSLATCSAWIHGGVPFLFGLNAASVTTGFFIAVATVTIIYFAFVYAMPAAGAWIGVARLVLIGGGSGLALFFVLTAVDTTGAPGLLSVVLALVSVITFSLSVASLFASPRRRSGFMTATVLSSRAFRRELLIVIWYVALSIVLAGAVYASYGALHASAIPGM